MDNTQDTEKHIAVAALVFNPSVVDMDATVTILMLLNSLNSCVNPWIYLFFNRNLLQALRSRMCRRCSSHKGTDSSAASSLVTASCSRAASTRKKTSSKHVTFLRTRTAGSVGRRV
ncbi:hypothetical protein HPB52_015689 [Rhipicephalus sanguineus]|uniref:G-protein coupled receptors family 1 profile domain-containing protein n=1 Tax=Rhipicephalus sanguineus TaxID=34632 RepID=A0A9D4Q0R5_RHISA|nr:hypothetical protein HPB52_015689 [Rhipicephalus sanguineus]